MNIGGLLPNKALHSDRKGRPQIKLSVAIGGCLVDPWRNGKMSEVA